ncbi:MAG TPA: hypothetical protein VMI56_26760, partial [Reyranella sp.]|nr:hypothetical protein [Reyranella sp.]
GIIALFILTSLVIVEATFEDTVIVEPVIVPKALAEAGYDGKAVAQKLVAQVGRISQESSSSRQKVEFGGESRFADAAAIRVPSSELSLRSLVTLLRNFLDIPDNRITGELTLAYPGELNAAPQFTLALHFVNAGKPSFYKPRQSPNIDELIEAAAHDVAEEYDPVARGAYLLDLSKRSSPSDKPRATEAAREFDAMIGRLLGKVDDRTLPWILNLQGLRLQHQGKSLEAHELLERILREYPTFGMGYANAADALERGAPMAASRDVELRQRNRDEVALEYYRQALRFASGYAVIHNNIGVYLVRRERTLEGIEEFRKAAQLDPKYAPAQANWGMALAVLAEKKIPSPKESIEPEELCERRWILPDASRERLIEAVGKLRRASELDSRWPDIYSSWGEALVRLADPSSRTFRPEIEAAMVKLREALRIRDTFAEASRNLGFAYERLGENAEATRWYIKAIGQDPKDRKTYRGLGCTLPRLGTGEARMAFDAAYEDIRELNAIP